MSRPFDLVLLLFVAAAIFLFALGDTKLWDRDEPRNAGCAREMLQRNDWVTPVFNEEIRDAKPVLLYWLMMVAYQVFGENEFAARLPSALAAIGTVFAVFLIGDRLFHRRAGIAAGYILATSLMFGVAGRAATPDALLVFFSTASLAIFVRSTYSPGCSPLPDSLSEPERLFPSLGPALLMYSVMGLGVLAKGPIGFLMPTAIIGMYLLLKRLPSDQRDKEDAELSRDSAEASPSGLISVCYRGGIRILRSFHPLHFIRTCLSMKLGWAVMMVVLVAAPWYIWVGIRTDGEFLKTFFLKEHLGRSTTSFESHSGSIFYYPMVMSLGFFPWSVFALPVIYSLVRFSKVVSPGQLLMLCWVGVQVGLFTLVQTKLPSYVTPCYPALAILVASWLSSWSTGEIKVPRWMVQTSLVTLLVAGIAITGGVGYALNQFLQQSWGWALVGAIPLMMGCLGLSQLRVSVTGERQHWVPGLVAGSILFSLLFFGGLLGSVSQRQSYSAILEPYSGKPEMLVGSYGCLEPTWVFYGRHPIYELGDMQISETPVADRDWQKKSRPGVVPFLKQPEAMVITTAALLAEIRKSTDGRIVVRARTPYFLKSKELVLIQWEPEIRSRITQVPSEGRVKR